MPKDQLTYLPLSDLQPNPFQPRERIKKEEIADLVTSVKSYGILEPLLVAKTPAGYQIIAGERRWRAAKEAGLTEVPVSIRQTTPKLMLELALVENVQRKDLNAIERAQGFQQLIREFGFDYQTLADKIGKSQSYVTNTLRLIDLPDAIKDGLIDGLITEGHARALAGLADERQAISCYREIVQDKLSVRQAEQAVRNAKLRTQSTQQADKPPELVAATNALASHLDQFFRVPTKLKLSRSSKQTRVIITLKGGWEKTEADLQRLIDKLVTEAK